MKRLPDSNQRLRKVASTVSAVALMLGVSEAASIGFNFQVNYCGATAAYRNNVTATAFGVPTNAWENLTPMMTGYGSIPCDQFAYTLNEVINTTTSTAGLNPIPNGSITINWNAPTANWSHWGGYDRPPPYYDFAGSAVIAGEGEVYAGFLRDGLNFGPPDGLPDNANHLPPYSIDITGLKSLFTNSAFVVQLISSSDSMYHLTNAFVIDATASTTQSVIYPNIPIPRDQGDAPWIRGFGGGLSTVSTTLNTDHLQLIGNFPEHVGSADAKKTNSINNASCISGFIITDKPIVSMSPRSVLAGAHDTIILRTIAAGVPPLHYQWRLGGIPISGASASVYGVTNITTGGNYDVVVTNFFGSTTSKVANVTLDRIQISPGPGTSTNTINWLLTNAVLQSADSAVGPFLDISPSATSPYFAPVASIRKFYRYRRNGAIVTSNPYDM